MKVAIVHDWLIHMRGGEKVLEALCEIFPDAVIYTLFHDRRRLSPVLQGMRIKTSFLDRLPGIRRYYRFLLPFFPQVIESLKMEDVDLVISSSHCVAKGIRTPQGAMHVCYCHTPMRYAWGFDEEYFGKVPRAFRWIVRFLLSFLKKWDLKSNETVDLFIANSENVKRRIENFYGRDAIVIHPPADTLFYQLSGPPGNYYLVVSAFVPYKRVDLVIEAFNTLNRKLLIAGDGPLKAHYRKLRRSDKISFLGPVRNEELRTLYQKARALIFPTEEDFGIVPVEAQACGTPVIALAKGGALETVKQGLFFTEQSAAAIREAVMKFESMDWDRPQISQSVGPFDRTFFMDQIRECIHQRLNRRPVYAVR